MFHVEKETKRAERKMDTESEREGVREIKRAKKRERNNTEKKLGEINEYANLWIKICTSNANFIMKFNSLTACVDSFSI